MDADHFGIGRILVLGPNWNSNPTQRIRKSALWLLSGSRAAYADGVGSVSRGRSSIVPVARIICIMRMGAFRSILRWMRIILTVLPENVDEMVIGPVLCAGLTAYKVFLFTMLDSSLPCSQAKLTLETCS